MSRSWQRSWRACCAPEGGVAPLVLRALCSSRPQPLYESALVAGCPSSWDLRLSWRAFNAFKLAGPDHDARRVDGPHPGFRGLDPSVQAARARLAVSVGNMCTAPPSSAPTARGSGDAMWTASGPAHPPALQTAEGVCCILGASVGVAAAAACCANAPCTLCVPCRSVVETIKIVTETLEALFNMQLAIPAGVERCLTEGVDNALQK